MTVGNTNKTGSGSTYWVVVDNDGRMIPGDSWTPDIQSDVLVDDSDKTFVVPAGYQWKIQSIYVSVVTNGTAGNRQLAVKFTDGSDNVILEIYAGIVQAASLTRNYSFGVGLPDLTAFRNTSYLTTPLPADLILPAGYKVRILDTAAVAAAGDDLLIKMTVVKRIVS